MSGQTVLDRPSSSFDFVLVEGDSHDSSTVISSPNQTNPWIDPTTIKLRHRIGRGPFGDVWLATHRQVSTDYEEYHEVAVKMLYPVKEDNIREVLNRLNSILFKCHGLETVCLLHGFSVINKKICIVSKFYECSVGDRMARLKEEKLTLSDVLRYGADLAQGIMDLHAKEILILNLKPCNFLLNSDDQAVVGDIGIPYVLLGTSLPSPDMARWLGTPNYMAPEQWQPEVRGPISVETDSWGFGCSILEMLTSKRPWTGKSIEEIYNSVVTKQERPQIPSGLPPDIENVLSGCFEYDFRSRPVMADILHAFKRSQNVVNQESRWTGLESRLIHEKSGGIGLTKWFLEKDHLEVGDVVRSRKSPLSHSSKNMEIPEGTIVGLEGNTDQDGFILVRVHGVHDPIRTHISTLEGVTFGLASGDWIRLKREDKRHSPVGILHAVNRDGTAVAAFVGLETLWKGNCSDFQMAKPYWAGQFVRLKASVFSPRFEWRRKRGGEWAAGRISRVLPNGCLVVNFPGRLRRGGRFLADPAEVELVVRKWGHMEDFHWAVRPLLVALGLFMGMKLGFLVGGRVGPTRSREGNEDRREEVEFEGGPWKVAEIFR